MPDVFTTEPKKEEEHADPKHAHHSAKLSDSLPHPEDIRTPGLFSSYTPNPQGITFQNQEEGETMVLFLRKHFITNVPWIFFTAVFLLIPPFYFAVIHAFDFRFFPVPLTFTIVLVTFYYLLVAMYALGNFIVWFYHVGIVTHKRLMDLDLDNVLHFDMAEAELQEIVDVSYTQKGFFQSYFNFGNVFIQTEALKAHFEFELTPNPAQVADIITDLHPLAKIKAKHDA